MFRRKSDPAATDFRGSAEGDIDDLPKFDDELSPREVMARLTRKIEQKIDASFGRKTRIHNEHA
jgi:hypothetical protein